MSTVVIFNFESAVLLYATSLFLLIYLLITYFIAFTKPFKKSILFESFSNLSIKLTKSSFTKRLIEINEELRGKELNTFNQTQEILYANNLQLAVIAHRGMYFIANKLSMYKKSRIYLYHISINIIFLFLFSAFIFSLINFALYKISSSNFAYSGTFGWFDFLYYSSFAMFSGGSENLSPVSILSKVIKMIMLVSAGIIILTIILNVSFLVKGEKYKEDIDELAETLKKNSEYFQNFISEEYNLSIFQAIEILHKLKSGFITLIFMLSQDIPGIENLRSEDESKKDNNK